MGAARLLPLPARGGRRGRRSSWTPGCRPGSTAVASQLAPWDRMRSNPQTGIRDSQLHSSLQERVRKVSESPDPGWDQLGVSGGTSARIGIFGLPNPCSHTNPHAIEGMDSGCSNSIWLRANGCAWITVQRGRRSLGDTPRGAGASLEAARREPRERRGGEGEGGGSAGGIRDASVRHGASSARPGTKPSCSASTGSSRSRCATGPRGGRSATAPSAAAKCERREASRGWRRKPAHFFHGLETAQESWVPLSHPGEWLGASPRASPEGAWHAAPGRAAGSASEAGRPRLPVPD